METSKANTSGSTNPHVRKQRQKTSQRKWWEMQQPSTYCEVSKVAPLGCLSKERTSFKLLWERHSGKGSASQGSATGTSCSRVAQTAAVSEQGSGDSQCLTNAGHIHALAWQTCPRADQSPTAPQQPSLLIHLLIIKITPNSNLNSFVDEAGYVFSKSQKT